MAPLIYSATWHFAKKISFVMGLFSHDSHVMRTVMSSNSRYLLKAEDYFKGLGSMASTDVLLVRIIQREQAII